MTQYVTCFDNFLDDGLPRGWSKRWNIATNLIGPYNSAVSATGIDYDIFPGPNDRVPVKRRCMRMARRVSGGASTLTLSGAYSWDKVGALADFNLLGCVSEVVNAFGGSGSTGIKIRFRCSGADVRDWSGYYIAIGTNAAPSDINSRIVLGYTARGIDTEISHVLVSAPSLAAGVHYFRLNVSGTHIQFKYWAFTGSDATTSEPGAWTIDTNDSSISGAGWLGFENPWKATTITSWQWLDLNFVSVGTNGDAPVAPLTNDAFKAWLTTPAQRCYLFEATALGYAANGGYSGNFTKEALALASNIGYVSAAWDEMPSQPYPPILKAIPSFKRDIGAALTGKATQSFGSVVIDNSADASGVGPRENWLRMKWKRNYGKVSVGDPSWPRHDFRPFIIGRLQMPSTGSNNSEISFPMNDLSDMLTQDANPLIYTSGAYAGQRVPVVYGSDGTANGTSVAYNVQIEPPLIDPNNLIYQLSRHNVGAFASDTTGTIGTFLQVFDNQVALYTGIQTTTSVANATATTFTVSGGHSMINGYFLMGIQGNAGTGIVAGGGYFVVNSTSTTFQLANTPGGTPLLFAGASAGDKFRGFGYYLDNDGDGVISNAVYAAASYSGQGGAFLYLVAKPSGRVTASCINWVSDAQGDQRSILGQVILDAGLSRGVANAPLTLTNPTKCQLYLDTQKVSAENVLTRLAKALFMWYGFAADGFLEYGELLLPSATPSITLLESDVKQDSLKRISSRLPVDFSKAQLWVPWFLTGGAFQTGSQAALQGKSFVPPIAYSGSGAPLDNYPQAGDLDQTFSQEMLFTGAFSYYQTLFGLPIGLYQFSTTMKAFTAKVGDTIMLSHSREDWEQFSPSNPASPDNAGATIDSRYARVASISINPDASDPYPITLTVWKQIPGYYPTADVITSGWTQNPLLAEDGSTLLDEDGVTPLLEENGVL